MEAFKIQFYATLQGDFDIIHEYIDVLIDNQSGGGKAIWDYKLSKIVSLIDTYVDKDVMLYVFDLDIQFFEDFTSTVDEMFAQYELDMAFQAENIFQGANIGICVMRTNRQVKKFWQDVYKTVQSTKAWDQKIVNDYIWRNAILNYTKPQLKIGILPKQFYACSTTHVPSHMLLHHANCTTDFNEKWNQFLFIRNVIGKKKAFDKDAMKIFLTSEDIYFTPLSGKFFRPETCKIHDKSITINNYGTYTMVVHEDYLQLVKDDAIFLIVDYFVTDPHHKKTLAMGYFAEIGKHNGTYTRCYFVCADTAASYPKSSVQRITTVAPHITSSLWISYPGQDMDVLLGNFTESMRKQIPLRKDFFAPAENTAYRSQLKAFGDPSETQARHIFADMDTEAYETAFEQTWAQEGFLLTTSQYAPTVTEMFANNFYTVVFFTPRSVLLPMQQADVAAAMYQSFLEKSPAVPAMQALQDEVRDAHLTGWQKECVVYLAYWYTVFSQLAHIVDKGGQSSVPCISYTELLTADVRRLYELLKILFAWVHIDNKTLLIVAETILHKRPPVTTLHKKHELYTSLPREDFYQDILAKTVKRHDAAFLSSPWYPFLC